MTVNERLELLEELFIKMDLTIEMDSADDWEGCKDFVCYVAGDNSTFEDLYTSDEDTIELISKLKK